MQEAQYDFLHGQTDRSDFFSPAMQQLCGIMKDNQVALPSDIGEGYFRYISPCPNIEMYICDVMFYRDTVLRSKCIRILFPSFSLFPTHWSGSLRAETKKHCWKREIAAYTAAVCLMRKTSMRQGREIYRRRAEPAPLSVSVCDGWLAEEKGLHRL